MKRMIAALLICGLLTFMLSACSSNSAPQGQDPSKVTIELVTDPEPVPTKQKVKITAQVTGLVKEEGAKVQFDIRRGNNGLPELLTAEPDGKGGYSTEKTFDRDGKYTVYIHLYQGELHITKKKQFDVS